MWILGEFVGFGLGFSCGLRLLAWDWRGESGLCAGSRWLPCPLYHTTRVRTQGRVPRSSGTFSLALVILRRLGRVQSHQAPPDVLTIGVPEPPYLAESEGYISTLLRFLPRLYGFVTPDMGLTLVIVDQFLGSWLERLSACTEKALRWVSTRPCPNVTSTVGFERDGSLDSWLDRLFIRSSMWDISRTIRVVVFAFRRGCGSEQRLYALPIGSLCGLSLVTFVKRAEKRGPQWMEIRGTCPRNLAAYWCFAAA